MIKRALAFTLSAILVLTAFSGAILLSHAQEERLIGDIDLDGSITVSDALAALRAAAKISEYSAADIPVYDVSGDGEVDVADALGILRCAVRLVDDYGYDGVELSFAPNAAANAYGYTQQSIDKSIVSVGNTAKLAKVMRKAEKGERVTVVTLGGSITAGSVTQDSRNCYSYRTYQWWVNNYPNSKINYYNMGIGATGSVLGVHRLEDDVLKRNPDFLIVEYAVNDTPDVYEYYENIIRRVWLNNPDTAIIMLFMQNETGWNVQDSEIPIGRHYQLPMISYRDATNPRLVSGEIKWKDISPDDIHPNDEGHGMVASLITSYLDGVKAKASRLSKVVPQMPEALYGERYMNAKLYMGGKLEPDSIGAWAVDRTYNFYHLNGAWEITKRGNNKPLTFTATFKELTLAILMRATSSNLGDVKLTIDGGDPIKLSNNAVGSWGDHLEFKTVFKEDVEKEHTLSFSYIGGKFTLCGLMLS